MSVEDKFKLKQESYKAKLGELEIICRDLTKIGKDRSEGFMVVSYLTEEGGVMIVTEDVSEEKGEILRIDFFHDPLRDEDGTWFLPATVYSLDAAGNLASYPDKEKDPTMVKGLMRPQVKELIDFPKQPIEEAPAELPDEISEEEWDRIIDLANEYNAPRKAAEELETTAVSEDELDEVLRKLRQIQANPKVINFDQNTF